MICVQATCLKIETLTDRSLKIRFETQEVDDQAASDIISARGKFGWLVFNDKELTKPEDLDLPDVTPKFKGEKTPSQRLRGVLYRKWEQTPEKQGETKMTFELYYRSKMGELIEYFKKQLD